MRIGRDSSGRSWHILAHEHERQAMNLPVLISAIQKSDGVSDEFTIIVIVFIALFLIALAVWGGGSGRD